MLRTQGGQRQADARGNHAHPLQGPFDRNRVGLEEQILVERGQTLIQRGSRLGIPSTSDCSR